MLSQYNKFLGASSGVKLPGWLELETLTLTNATDLDTVFNGQVPLPQTEEWGLVVQYQPKTQQKLRIISAPADVRTDSLLTSSQNRNRLSCHTNYMFSLQFMNRANYNNMTTRIRVGRPEFDSSSEQRFHIFATLSRMALVLTYPPSQIVAANSPEMQRRGSRTDTSVENRSGYTWSYTTTPYYVFIARCLTKNNLTLKIRALLWMLSSFYVHTNRHKNSCFQT